MISPLGLYLYLHVWLQLALAVAMGGLAVLCRRRP